MQYQFKVKKSERGVTIENFLHGKLENWSHKKIKQAIDKKRVFVNGRQVFISKWNLKPNDRVEFRPEKADYPSLPALSKYHFVKVLHEDPYLLACDKPPFVDYDSYVAQVNAYLKRTSPQKKFYPYLGQMHRLDKETSGVIIFTKKKMANILADQFRGRRIRKIYLAVVEGRVEREEGVIRGAIEKGRFEGGKKGRISREGKESVTLFRVKERYDDATLLEVRLGTGRTHQIRIHMSEMGYPVVGDKLYRGADKIPNSNPPEADQIPKEKSSIVNRQSSIKRQALHAWRIEFEHPVTRKWLKITAPIPEDMGRLIDKLRTGSQGC
ncbi:MAG: RluA family pseudouridine synthase [Deltaproteobacteria bacterium]|nr:RluA family pseudouridine synthase [Deltaproteobacteria bacterium]